MGIREWLIPQEKIFFKLLRAESEEVVKGAEALVDLFKDYRNVAEKRKRIKKIERKADKIVHQLFEQLHRTFITPLDHDDIARLAYLHDDVLDLIYSVVNRVYLYQIKTSTPEMRKFSQIILKQVKEADIALDYLETINQKAMDHSYTEVNRLENLADSLLNHSVASLFENNGDLHSIIKLKEIYEWLETTTDKAEDLIMILRSVAIKNS